MSSGVLDWLLLIAFCFTYLLGVVYETAASRAINRHTRYVATTLAMLCLSLALIVVIMQVATRLARGEPMNAAVFAFAGCLVVWQIIKLFNNDNWFNSQWKKLKGGLKNLRQRLQFSPHPAPSPA